MFRVANNVFRAVGDVVAIGTVSAVEPVWKGVLHRERTMGLAKSHVNL